MKVMRPAWRVRTSCASMAPSAFAEMTRADALERLRIGTASSIRPPIETRISRQPCHRMLSATRRGEDRVEDQPAGGERQDQADEDADRGEHVGEQMDAVGGQRRRAAAAAGAAPEPQPQTPLMHAGHGRLTARPGDRLVEHMRRAKPAHAAEKIEIAAMTISTPSRTTEKYSAL